MVVAVMILDNYYNGISGNDICNVHHNELHIVSLL